MDDVLAAVATYPGIFLLCAASGTLVPMPEDVPLLYAGMQVGTGQLAWTPTLVAALSGVLLRDLIMYGIGYGLGKAVLDRPWLRRFLGESRIDDALQMVAKRGGGAVMIGRFMVGVRASVFLVAGAFGVRPLQFIVYDVLGLLIAVPLVVYLGYLFGEPAVAALLWGLENRAAGIAILVGIVALLGLSWWLRTRWKKAAVNDSRT